MQETSLDDWREGSGYNSQGWARARMDVPMRPPRTRPVFSGELPRMLQPVGERSRWSLRPHWIYVVSGIAAMALGIYTSNALVPLFEPVSAEPPLSRHSEWREDPAVRPRAVRANERATAVRKAPRRQTLTPGKNNRPAITKNVAAAPDPNAEPDMDLMDIPSSPMEQRALAQRGRTSVASDVRRSDSVTNTAEALSKLDLIQDPGAATGTLNINSRPWTHVFIDERLVGTTPLMGLTISSGHHRIRLMSEAFGMSKVLDVNVAAGERVTRIVSLGE